jgi:HEPN domain-containing protein
LPSIHKNELTRLAEEKAADAKLLLEHGRYSNAYYLAGYAVEIGLKAVISREFRADTLPDKGFVNKIYVHKLIELVRLAGLETEFENRRRIDADFRTAANVIADWSEEARYRNVEPTVAKAMLEAVLDEDAGFLPWLKTHW